MSKSALMASSAMPTYRNDAEAEEKKALESEKKEGEKGAIDDAAKADAEAGHKLDRMLSCLDSMSKRMDALDALEEPEKKDDDDDDDCDDKMDAEEDDKREDKRKDSKRRKDEDDDKPAFMKDKKKDSKKDAQVNKIAADDDDDEDMDEDDDKAKELAADKAKKDARKDSRRADSELAELRREVEKMKSDRMSSYEDRSKFAEVQKRADSAYQMMGDNAPHQMPGEELLDYRRRLLDKVKVKAPEWKDHDFSRADSALLDIAERQVYKVVMDSAMSPADLAEGHLRMIRKTDETGRTHIMWAGQPRAWMQQFQPPTRRVTSFETRSNSH